MALFVAGALLAATPVSAQEVVEYYGTDHLGSVRVVYNAAGTVLSRADYLPFGEEVAAPAGPMPAERFTGQARDGEAGQDYFHARMYQPRSGRFNTVDPIYAGLFYPGKWNRYAYARNSPTNLVDPFGLDDCPAGTPSGHFCTSNNSPPGQGTGTGTSMPTPANPFAFVPMPGGDGLSPPVHEVDFGGDRGGVAFPLHPWCS